MNLLLHLCCGPCSTYPVKVLREQGIDPQGFFHNPNIHPYREFKKRVTAVSTMADKMKIPVHIDKEYGLKKYMQKVVFNEEKRCTLCYRMRLEATVRHAKEIGAEAFSTTLLYSRYQQHNMIRRQAEKLAEEYEIPFYYQDFRDGWQEGIETSIEMDLYRQPYCGCIYSEQERYDKSYRRPAPKITP